ncbi:MAG: alpha-amylase/4-alpha-glucanotransferase domain-containing protein, partial [Candidatus Margulisiibacteriota bacterium]
MKTINLILGVNFEQPVGMPDYLVEQAYHEKYVPFFKVLQDYPLIKVQAYISGYLLDWLEKYHGEFINCLNELTRRGQIEFLTGGYYSPLLPLLQSFDRQGQIKRLTEKIKQLFRFSPTGVWLTEQAYSPELVDDLVELGIEYTVLSEYQFRDAGVTATDCLYPLLVDRFGKTLKVFAASDLLPQILPFQDPDQAVLWLKKMTHADSRRAAVVFFDCAFSEKYLAHFFDLIGANANWLTLVRAADYLEAAVQFKKIYLKESVPEKLTLESGGALQNFFSKYPEANHLLKRMLQVSEKIHTFKKGKTVAQSAERAAKISLAELELYQAQSGAAYWPRLAGGINLPGLRDAVFAHLIAAENLIAELTVGNQKFADLSVFDFDGDGQVEILAATEWFNAYFAPNQGGVMFELDLKPAKVNLLNSFADGAKQIFALRDHILAPEVTFADFKNQTAADFSDLADQPCTFLPQKKPGEIIL